MAGIFENDKGIIRMEKNKLKVAMICHFSNAEVREHLPLGKRRFYKIARKILRLPAKSGGYGDIAPWDNNIIQCIKERKDIELYVLSAHSGLKFDKVSFQSNGIHYVFFRPEPANGLRYLIPSAKLWRKMNPMAHNICKYIDKVAPDLVLLVGTENAYYSSSVLDIKGYPIYVLCQNIINNNEYVATGTFDYINSSTELEIIRQSKYLAVYCQKHYDLLKKLGYRNFIFDFNWPVPSRQLFTPIPCETKNYDFINFALHMSEDKGYHDSVKALSIVKRYYPDVKLCLIDGGNDIVRQELKQLIIELGLTDNVFFIPFFAEIKDLFQFLQTVRFAVLPCKIDFISGTQLQSMQYGLPVVCYKTAGTPQLNQHMECVLIAEMNNIVDLAEKMLLLLENPSLAERLRHNSFVYSQKRVQEAQNNMSRLVNNFRSIIDNYKYGIPIPKEQLYENGAL